MTQNLLQARNPATAIRVSRLIRKRLELMGADLWQLVKDGSAVVAAHAALAAAVKHSLLLGDFLDLVVRDQYRVFAKTLTNKLWEDYLDDCRGRDPDIPTTVLNSRPVATRDISTRPTAVVKSVGMWEHIEVIPHFRRPHMTLVWTGAGRKVPRLVPRRGSIVHREAVEKLPSGFSG